MDQQDRSTRTLAFIFWFVFSYSDTLPRPEEWWYNQFTSSVFRSMLANRNAVKLRLRIEESAFWGGGKQGEGTKNVQRVQFSPPNIFFRTTLFLNINSPSVSLHPNHQHQIPNIFHSSRIFGRQTRRSSFRLYPFLISTCSILISRKQRWLPLWFKIQTSHIWIFKMETFLLLLPLPEFKLTQSTSRERRSE